jgi:hypothetical protein
MPIRTVSLGAGVATRNDLTERLCQADLDQSSGAIVPHVHQLDTSLTINEIVAQYPETIAAFNRFGMDTCCGGVITVEEATRRDGINADDVVAELRQVVDEP